MNNHFRYRLVVYSPEAGEFEYLSDDVTECFKAFLRFCFDSVYDLNWCDGLLIDYLDGKVVFGFKDGEVSDV